MKKTLKSIVALLLAILMVASLAACASSDDKAADDGAAVGDDAAPSDDAATGDEAAALTKLVMGTSADYPPFEFIYLDDSGNQIYAGIDVSLAQQIADDMGVELSVTNMNFDSLIAALSKGEVDMVIAAMEADDERLASADASDPYYTDLPAMILVKAENAGNYKAIEDFSGKNVGAQTGTTKADIVTSDMAGANYVGLTSVVDLVNELVYDKCDAIVLDGAVAMKYAEENEDLVVSDVALGEALPFRVWVEKGDPKGILDDINASIKAAVDGGKIDEWSATADELSSQAAE